MSVLGTINSVISAASRTVYDFIYQISPVVLTGGIFAESPYGFMPIAALTSAMSLIQGAVTNQAISLDDYPIRFMIIPGNQMINNSIATYPFANQYTAANAIIFQPLPVSLIMLAPVKDIGGYLTKQAVLSAMKNTLSSHIAAGGTFDIMTPALNYYNTLLATMTDITGGDTRQQQIIYQLDFVQPLITEQQAQAAMGSTMSKISGGGQITSSSWSGQTPSVSSNAGNPMQIQGQGGF